MLAHDDPMLLALLEAPDEALCDWLTDQDVCLPELLYLFAGTPQRAFVDGLPQSAVALWLLVNGDRRWEKVRNAVPPGPRHLGLHENAILCELIAAPVGGEAPDNFAVECVMCKSQDGVRRLAHCFVASRAVSQNSMKRPYWCGSCYKCGQQHYALEHGWAVRAIKRNALHHFPEVAVILTCLAKEAPGRIGMLNRDLFPSLRWDVATWCVPQIAEDGSVAHQAISAKDFVAPEQVIEAMPGQFGLA